MLLERRVSNQLFVYAVISFWRRSLGSSETTTKVARKLVGGVRGLPSSGDAPTHDRYTRLDAFVCVVHKLSPKRLKAGPNLVEDCLAVVHRRLSSW